MEFITDYFKQNFKIATSRAKLTCAEGEIEYEINPWALASISALYRTIPTPEDDIFELNQNKYLKNSEDITCFFAMCRESVPALTDKEPNLGTDNSAQYWCNVNSFYAASRLCDFLGIAAASMISTYPAFFNHFQDNSNGGFSRIQQRLIYHQIALITLNVKAQAEIACLLGKLHRAKYQQAAEYSSQKYGYHSSFNSKTSFTDHNDQVIGLQALYYDFCDRPGEMDPATKLFLMKDLGWKAKDNVHYGLCIALE